MKIYLTKHYVNNKANNNNNNSNNNNKSPEQNLPPPLSPKRLNQAMLHLMQRNNIATIEEKNEQITLQIHYYNCKRLTIQRKPIPSEYK